jgi:hypothetical protein
MNSFVRLARPGYTLALLTLILGLGFLITGSAEGGFVVAVLEGAFWTSLQFFKDRHGKCLTPRA